MSQCSLTLNQNGYQASSTCKKKSMRVRGHNLPALGSGSQTNQRRNYPLPKRRPKSQKSSTQI
uniref:Uncharacterized protein n=1 Tax=Daphnia magna TaxID=35525 RepID=A0A0P6BBU2_9CRUS